MLRSVRGVLFLVLSIVLITVTVILSILNAGYKHYTLERYNRLIESDIGVLEKLLRSESPFSLKDGEEGLLPGLAGNCDLKLILDIKEMKRVPEGAAVPETPLIRIDKERKSSTLSFVLNDRHNGLWSLETDLMNFPDFQREEDFPYDPVKILILFLIFSLPLLLSLVYFFVRGNVSNSLPLLKALDRVSQGERDVPIPSGQDTMELSALSQGLCSLQQRLKNREEEQFTRSRAISHDLKGPVASIYSRIESVELGMIPLDKECFDQLYGELRVISSMVEDLSLLHKLKDPSIRPEIRSIPLEGEIIAPLLSRYQVLADAGKKEIVTDYQDCRIRADPVLLIRGIGNLLHNALLYSTSPRISFISRKEEERIVFNIENTCSLSGNDLKDMTTPYRRYNPETPGEGLGLSIARAIAEKHGGTLQSRLSEEGRITLSLSLPQIQGG